ncbi:MAG: efflux RND transporter periplasmic adaptor subunit [Myxococcota bacterium]|nr:efflux RND transporter periplasmic adaptor subunit [Myxococcota bacterium]
MPAIRRTLPLLTLSLGLTLLSACRGGPPGPEGYMEEESTAGDLALEVTAVGTLAPIEEVEIGSDLTGEVAEVLVDVNDRVKAGQVLARIEPAEFEMAVSEAKGTVQSAQAAISTAKVNLEKGEADHARLQRLMDKGAATQVEVFDARIQVDLYKAQLASAQAQLAQARSSLERAQQDLEDTEIRSPIDGVILDRQVDPGQTVVSSMSTTTLFTVASDLARMKAEVDIDEADVARLSEEQPATFSVSAYPSESFPATVYRVALSPDEDADTVVYVAELRLDNADGRLRPGMTATATIETGRVEDATLVPSAALRFAPRGESAGDKVWQVQGEKSPPSAIPVTVLGSDGNTTAVSGLDAGTRVITGEM